MTKKEIYEILKENGETLKSISCYRLEDLENMYNSFVVKQDVLEDDSNNIDCCNNEQIYTLVFNQSGWCEELGKSYFIGIYRPLNAKEYNILKQYASGEIK